MKSWVHGLALFKPVMHMIVCDGGVSEFLSVSLQADLK